MLIAHADGVTADGRYSNTLESIEAAYNEGIRWIEVDVSMTADGHLVLIHDWGSSWEYWFRPHLSAQWHDVTARDLIPTRAQFLATPMRGGRTPTTVSALCDWIGTHPDTRAFFDLKADPAQGLPQASQDWAKVRGQLVIYLPDERSVDAARRLGFQHLAASSYYRSLSLPEMRKLASSGAFTFVDLGLDDFTLDEFATAVSWGVPVIAWTLNNEQTARELASIGVAGAITDRLRPVKAPSKR